MKKCTYNVIKSWVNVRKYFGGGRGVEKLECSLISYSLF